MKPMNFPDRKAERRKSAKERLINAIHNASGEQAKKLTARLEAQFPESKEIHHPVSEDN